MRNALQYLAPAALVVALAAGAAQAQPGVKPKLTILASPDPDQTVAGKSVLSFSATVPQTGHDYRVELGSTWATEWRNPGQGIYSATLPFTATYAVPSTVKPGGHLCFSLTRRAVPKSTVIGTLCRTVTAPSVNTGTGPAPTLSTGTATGSPQSRTDRSARIAGGTSLPALPPADLTVTFQKTPVAKWVVRNVGQGPAPATVLRLTRAGLPSKDIPVAALPAGAIVDIVVTPDLDGYLINASAKVDPNDQVKESNETNNTWQSAQSR